MGDAERVDGRRLRGERSRDAVVDAILELLREGVDQPGAAEIAERSGVSVRSVFRHFDDLESLYAVAVDRQMLRVAPLFEAPFPAGSLDERISALIAQRVRLYEEIHPVRRAGERLRGRSKVIRDHLDASHALLRRHLTETFASELDERSGADRRQLLDALDAATSWLTWYQLRDEQGLSASKAAGVMDRQVRALFS